MKKIKSSIVFVNEDYKIIDLLVEYPNEVGNERYAVSTNCTKEYLFDHYKEQLKPFEPFIIVGAYYGELIVECVNETRRQNYNNKTKFALYSLDDITVLSNQSLHILSCELQMEERQELIDEYNRVRRAFLMLESKTMKRRIYKRYWKKQKVKQIAEEEGFKPAAISLSITTGLKKIKENIRFLEINEKEA